MLYPVMNPLIKLVVCGLWGYLVYKTQGLKRKILILGFIRGIVPEIWGVSVGLWGYTEGGIPLLLLAPGWAKVLYAPYRISSKLNLSAFSRTKKQVVGTVGGLMLLGNYVFGTFAGYILLLPRFMLLVPLILTNIPATLLLSGLGVLIDTIGLKLNLWVFYTSNGQIETAHNLLDSAIAFTYAYFLVVLLSKYLERAPVSRTEVLRFLLATISYVLSFLLALLVRG